MSQIFRYRRGQPVNWFHRILRRSNIYCLYCGAFVGEGSAILSNREHLIGRKFVPAGSLGATSFNFIFRACEACNARKASAERHVSAVTLFNSPARLLDPQVDLLARHKAGRDYHPKKKGVLVQDANEHQVIDFVRPGVHIRFGLTGPPQLQPDEVRLLALRHIQGLFALVTTEDPLVAGKARILPDDQFYFYACYTVRA